MIKRYLLPILVVIVGVSLNAQVTFIIDSVPTYTPPEDLIYFAGDINGWNPGDVNHIFEKNDADLWEHRLDSFPEGITIEYKFTRGDWSKVEKGPNGEEIANRTFTFGNGDTVHVIIHNWADHGGGAGSTAAENVIVMDEDFEMPQLDRTRRIWLYFPPDYEESSNRYPVLYMHDGQNLFDQFTSFAGEWEVDETLNDLFDQGYQVPIVVGIDNGGTDRINELTPWNNPEFGGGQGDEYMAFITETLKPYIDENYRTLPDRENTGIMGSSLGGLISTYGALKYPEIFSKSGPFSPAYWINNDSIWAFLAAHEMQQDIRFYQNVGELEHEAMISMMWQMQDSLLKYGYEKVTSKTIPNGEHNEQTWRNDFAEAYLRLFASFANDVTETGYATPLMLYPNPANDKLQLKNDQFKRGDHLIILNQSGQLFFDVTLQREMRFLNIGYLKAGAYMLMLSRDGVDYLGRFVKI